MQNFPEVGKTYVSQIDPTERLYVEAVHHVEADEEDGTEAGFFVEGCLPSDRDIPGGNGIEFTGEEWAEYRFTPEFEQPAG